MRVEIVLAKRGMPEQAEGPRNTGVDRREKGRVPSMSSLPSHLLSFFPGPQRFSHTHPFFTLIIIMDIYM